MNDSDGENNLKPNLLIFSIYTIVLGLGALQTGWCYGANMQIADILAVKFSWDTQ